MPLKSYFRVLLVLYAALIFGELASAQLTIKTLPEPIRKYAEDQWIESLPKERAETLEVVSMAALTLMFVSVLGLWALWRPARLLYTVYLLCIAISVVLAGPVVESELTSVLSFMNTIISGLILGMIYFSPLRDHFDAPPLEKAPES